MYVKTYGAAGQKLWFKNADDLKRYACGVWMVCYKTTPKAYVLFQPRRLVNKISLGCHDGTQEGKKYAVQLRIDLLSTPGYMVEASDASSWILRKNNVPIIRNPALIEELVIADPTKEKIEMNENFNPEDKTSQGYFRIFYRAHDGVTPGVVPVEEFRNAQTLFGIDPKCIEWSDEADCERTCKRTASQRRAKRRC